MANQKPICASDDEQTRIAFFRGVEALRKVTLLSVGDMVALLEVSRATYRQWREGAKPRQKSAVKIDEKVKLLLDLFDGKAHHPDKWPTNEAISAPRKQRSVLFQQHLAANDELAKQTDEAGVSLLD